VNDKAVRELQTSVRKSSWISPTGDDELVEREETVVQVHEYEPTSVRWFVWVTQVLLWLVAPGCTMLGVALRRYLAFELWLSAVIAGGEWVCLVGTIGGGEGVLQPGSIRT
jgi:hypothetical protein